MMTQIRPLTAMNVTPGQQLTPSTVSRDDIPNIVRKSPNAGEGRQAIGLPISQLSRTDRTRKYEAYNGVFDQSCGSS